MINLVGKMKILLIVLFTFIPASAFAFSYNKISTLKYDLSLSDQTNTIYATPTSIYLTQVSTQSESLQKNPELWSKALFYYSITKLHFSDMPYNFLIDESGRIYEGRQGGVGANPELKNVNRAIVIGYLSNGSTLTTSASNSLLRMVKDLSESWGLSSYKTVRLQIDTKEGSLSTVVPVDSKGDFSQSVKEALASWKGSSREDLPYKAEIVEVIYEKNIVIGEKLEVTVKVKNMNDFTWLTDRTPIYVSTKDGKDSGFAVNGVWDSFSKPTHIEDRAVKPGDIVELKFKMQPKITPGKVSESFEIMKFAKKPFDGSAFEVTFTVEKGKYTLVRVYSPQYGFANIRECQWYSCKIIESAPEGTVYILKKELDGWMQIQYDEDTIGWVASRFMKRI